MKQRFITSFNFMAPIHLGASITLGVLGLVSWWILGLIWLMQIDLWWRAE